MRQTRATRVFTVTDVSSDVVVTTDSIVVHGIALDNSASADSNVEFADNDDNVYMTLKVGNVTTGAGNVSSIKWLAGNGLKINADTGGSPSTLSVTIWYSQSGA